MANRVHLRGRDHGHELGKCQNEATEANNLCADCHAKASGRSLRLKRCFLMNRFELNAWVERQVLSRPDAHSALRICQSCPVNPAPKAESGTTGIGSYWIPLRV